MTHGHTYYNILINKLTKSTCVTLTVYCMRVVPNIYMYIHVYILNFNDYFM